MQEGQTKKDVRMHRALFRLGRRCVPTNMCKQASQNGTKPRLGLFSEAEDVIVGVPNLVERLLTRVDHRRRAAQESVVGRAGRVGRCVLSLIHI